jgi:hypothetical protein
MIVKKYIKSMILASVVLVTGCCMDDMSCGGSNTYVPVSSCYSCNTGCKPSVTRCQSACTVCGYDGSYAYTSWY